MTDPKTHQKLISINVDSSQRISGTTHNFEFNFPSNIVNPQRIRLVEAEIPYTWYNIRDDLNKNIYLDLREPTGGGGTPFTIVLRPGYYTVRHLAESLELELNNNSPGAQTYTVTLDPFTIPGSTIEFTYRLIISCTSTFDMLFVTGPNAGNNMAIELGFSGLIDQVGTNSYNGNYYDNFKTPRELISEQSNLFEVSDSTPLNYTAILTPGSYNTTTLATELQNQLNASAAAAGSGAVFTVSYSNVTFKYTIACTLLYSIHTVTGIERYNSPYNLFGLDDNAPGHEVANTNHVSDFVPIVSGENYLIISSNLIEGALSKRTDIVINDEISPLNYEGILEKIPITVNSGSTIFYSNYRAPFNDLYNNLKPDNLAPTPTLRLMLITGDDMNINGADWSCKLQVYI